jgi:predicted nucleic acid-binding protein
MPASPRRVYFDANVFLAYVGDEKDRAPVVQSLLLEAGRNELEIVTSVLSITEVAYGALEKDRGLSEEGEAAIDELWTPASPVNLIDMSEALARRARALIRSAVTAGFGLRSADAVHLASAAMFSCAVVFTYEAAKTRRNWSGLVGAEVAEPYTERPTLDV